MVIHMYALLQRINRKVFLYFICVLLPFVISPLAASTHQESRCAYVLLIVAGYWILDPVPVAVTALIPIVLYPLLGVVSSTDVCKNYMKESFMTFIGGLIVALAVEDCKLHERIALKVLLLVGSELKWLSLGVMYTTMFLSMWVSNTATTAMMIPIVEGIIEATSCKTENVEMEVKDNYCGKQSKPIDDSEHKENSIQITDNKDIVSSTSTVKLALLLGVCYSANIGGTGTLTAIGPNVVLKGFMEDVHPDSRDITFASWMMYNLPGMVLCIAVGWLYLWAVYIRGSKSTQDSQFNENIKRIIRDRYNALGSISIHEAQVLVLFITLVFLWIFRDPKFVSGWSEAIGCDSKMVGDSVPSIGVALLLFFLPANPRDPGGKPILEWKTAQAKLPWGVVILVGGSLALADAAKKSGLSIMFGDTMASLQVLPSGAIAAIICFMTAGTTEIMSNLTTATIFLPVVNQMAISINVNPLYFIVPTTVACSYAFMLPVATTPNAIAFNSGKMKTLDMAKPGLFMNLGCCGVQLLTLNTLGVVMFDLHTMPNWSSITNSTSVFNSTAELNMTHTENIFNMSMNAIGA